MKRHRFHLGTGVDLSVFHGVTRFGNRLSEETTDLYRTRSMAYFNRVVLRHAFHWPVWTVMRADGDYREYVVRKYSQDVDEVIYPERLGAIVAKNALLGGNIHAIADIAPTLQLVELTVTDHSPMHGYTLSELELPGSARVLAFGKADGQMELPEPDQSLETGDRLIVIADYDVLGDVRAIIVGEDAPVPSAATGGV